MSHPAWILFLSRGRRDSGQPSRPGFPRRHASQTKRPRRFLATRESFPCRLMADSRAIHEWFAHGSILSGLLRARSASECIPGDHSRARASGSYRAWATRCAKLSQPASSRSRLTSSTACSGVRLAGSTWRSSSRSGSGSAANRLPGRARPVLTLRRIGPSGRPGVGPVLLLEELRGSRGRAPAPGRARPPAGRRGCHSSGRPRRGRSGAGRRSRRRSRGPRRWRCGAAAWSSPARPARDNGWRTGSGSRSRRGCAR